MDNRTTYSSKVKCPFCIRSAGFIRLDTQRTISATKGDAATLRLVVKGNCQFRYPKKSTVAGPFEAALSPPGDPGIILGDPRAPVEYYFCRFVGGYALEQVKHLTGASGQTVHFTGLPAERMGTLMRKFSRQRPFRQCSNACRMSLADLRLGETLMLLDQEPKKDRTKGPLLDGSKLEEYLLDHLHEPTYLSKMAEELGVSRSTLIRIARNNFSESIQKRHEREKMLFARQMLALPDLTVKEVAANLGYSDPLYFSRVFRKRFAQSPRQWRNKHIQA